MVFTAGAQWGNFLRFNPASTVEVKFEQKQEHETL